MAMRKNEVDPNESLEARVERDLREGHLRRAEEESRETPRRRKSPYLTAARIPRKEPSPVLTPPRSATGFREGDNEDYSSHQRFPDNSTPRKFAEDTGKPLRPREESEAEIGSENCCISVFLAVISTAALILIFAYSFLATKEVK